MGIGFQILRIFVLIWDFYEIGLRISTYEPLDWRKAHYTGRLADFGVLSFSVNRQIKNMEAIGNIFEFIPKCLMKSMNVLKLEHLDSQ